MKKIFIGIDFAKEKVDVTVKKIAEGTSAYGQFQNTRGGGRDMVRWVKRFAKGTPPEEWLFCGEDTGFYSQTITYYLVEKGYFMWLQNAYSIKKSEGGIRRGKSDKADSMTIAEYANRFQDKAVAYKRPPRQIEELKRLTSERDLYVESKTKIANSISEIPKMDKQGEAITLIKATNRRICKKLDEEIKAIEKEIDKIIQSEKEIEENYEILTSFPGVARINATAFIVFTENFQKFDLNPRKIATYWGVAPFSKESGTALHTKPHVSGFCNKKLKALITNAASVAISYNPIIKQYYNRRLSRGINENIAKNNVKNKIIHILTAMVRKKQEFDKDYFFTLGASVKNVNSLGN